MHRLAVGWSCGNLADIRKVAIAPLFKDARIEGLSNLICMERDFAIPRSLPPVIILWPPGLHALVRGQLMPIHALARSLLILFGLIDQSRRL